MVRSAVWRPPAVRLSTVMASKPRGVVDGHDRVTKSVKVVGGAGVVLLDPFVGSKAQCGGDERVGG